MRISLTAAFVLALITGAATAADFNGRYKVTGTSPGGGSYTGGVTIKQTGDATYQVVWKIGEDTFIGTGIGSPDGLAVGYKSGSSTGIAIYRRAEGGAVEGYWTFAGGQQIGTETWRR